MKSLRRHLHKIIAFAVANSALLALSLQGQVVTGVSPDWVPGNVPGDPNPRSAIFRVNGQNLQGATARLYGDWLMNKTGEDPNGSYIEVELDATYVHSDNWPMELYPVKIFGADGSFIDEPVLTIRAPDYVLSAQAASAYGPWRGLSVQAPPPGTSGVGQLKISQNTAQTWGALVAGNVNQVPNGVPVDAVTDYYEFFSSVTNRNESAIFTFYYPSGLANKDDLGVLMSVNWGEWHNITEFTSTTNRMDLNSFTFALPCPSGWRQFVIAHIPPPPAVTGFSPAYISGYYNGGAPPQPQTVRIYGQELQGASAYLWDYYPFAVVNQSPDNSYIDVQIDPVYTSLFAEGVNSLTLFVHGSDGTLLKALPIAIIDPATIKSATSSSPNAGSATFPWYAILAPAPEGPAAQGSLTGAIRTDLTWGAFVAADMADPFRVPLEKVTDVFRLFSQGTNSSDVASLKLNYPAESLNKEDLTLLVSTNGGAWEKGSNLFGVTNNPAENSFTFSYNGTQGLRVTYDFAAGPAPRLLRIAPNVINTAAATYQTDPSAPEPFIEIELTGSSFRPQSIVEWAGYPLQTIYVDSNKVKARIPASSVQEMQGGIFAEQFSVRYPNILSNPLIVTFVPGVVDPTSVQSQSAAPSQTVTVATSSTDSNGTIAGAVEAIFTRSSYASGDAQVTVALYAESPASAEFDINGAVMDLKVQGALETDQLSARFYIATGGENVLNYFNPTLGWRPVLLNRFDSASKPQAVPSTDLAGFSGYFDMVFSAQSEPAITELGGTFFAAQLIPPPDLLPPTVSCQDIVVAPSLDALVAVNYPAATVSDDTDRSPSVTYSIPSGSGFPLGQTVVTCAATDHSGKSSSTSFKVTRLPLNFAGFLSPVGGADATGGTFANPLRTFKLGSTIPVKFTASTDSAPVTTGIHRIQAIRYSSETVAGTPIDANPADSATTGNEFRYADGQWQFNLSTKTTGMSAGIWKLSTTLSDGSTHSVWTQIK